MARQWPGARREGLACRDVAGGALVIVIEETRAHAQRPHDAQHNDRVQRRHIHDNGGQQYRAEHLPVEPPAQVHSFHLDTSFGTKPNRTR